MLSKRKLTVSVAIFVIAVIYIGLYYRLHYGVKAAVKLPEDPLQVLLGCNNSVGTLILTIENNTFRTMENVSVHLKLYKDNLSVNLLERTNYYLPAVIEPFKTMSFCLESEYVDNQICDKSCSSTDDYSERSAIRELNTLIFEKTHKFYVRVKFVEFL